MSNELVNTQNGELMPQEEQTPKDLLLKAKTAAMALQDVITSNKRPPVMFNGKPYLEFAHWQVIATSYRVSVATKEAEYVKLGEVEGFKAKAEVIDQGTGLIVGTAEAYCMKDEPNWKSKPLFQLASMAQTRAGAKSLANKFRFVAIMAGYEPTPSEEMMASDKPGVKMPQEKSGLERLGEEIAFGRVVITPHAKQATIEDLKDFRVGPKEHIEWPNEPPEDFNDTFALDKGQIPAKPGATRSKFLSQLQMVAREAQLSPEKMKAAMQILYKKESSKDLTDTECADLIKQIQKKAIRNS